MAAGLLGRPVAADDDLVGWLVEMSGGNPLLVEYLVGDRGQEVAHHRGPVRACGQDGVVSARLRGTVTVPEAEGMEVSLPEPQHALTQPDQPGY